jgi:4'-phosphopantetheinyl transferase
MSLYPPFWELPPEELTCATRDIHLWLARLDVAENQRSYLEGILSPDECQRAEKFASDQIRAHFIAGRGFLRCILSRYLQMEPAQIRFRYNRRGKPFLERSIGKDALHFNLSHANGLALFGFTRTSEIGVDIEYINDQTDIEQTVALVFSPAETAAFQALPAAQRRNAFFQFWTRKEALIKAMGDGFSLPLREFDVSQAPEKPVLPIAAPNIQSADKQWRIKDINVLPGYVAAIAREGNKGPVSFFRMPDSYLL